MYGMNESEEEQLMVWVMIVCIIAVAIIELLGS